MIEFIKNMFSGNSEVSSKRVAGIIALFNAIIIGYISIYNKQVPQYVFDGLLMYSASILATTVITTMFQKKN